jgi:hypothetical protein
MSMPTEPASDGPRAPAATAPRHAVRIPRPDLLLPVAFCVLTVVVAIVFAHDGPAPQMSEGDRAGNAAPLVRSADQR